MRECREASEQHQLLIQRDLSLGQVGQVGHHQQILQQGYTLFNNSVRDGCRRRRSTHVDVGIEHVLKVLW